MSMKSLVDYYKERKGADVIHDEHGNFLSYYIKPPECYIEDLYVAPEFRKTKVASKMADIVEQIAKDSGCNLLSGTVDLKSLNPSLGIQAVLGYGMKYHSRREDLLIFCKEI